MSMAVRKVFGDALRSLARPGCGRFASSAVSSRLSHSFSSSAKADSADQIVYGEAVELSYDDLRADRDLTEAIGQAYGPQALGILTVKGVPGFEEKRERLLKVAHELANLSDEEKKKLEHPASTYSYGWSHGKETLDGKPDLLKGSYYANPTMDTPTTDEELIRQYPEYCHPNIWPDANVLPELEPAFKELGSLMVEVGKLVARQCDRYTEAACHDYRKRAIQTQIEESKTIKARLLHYFPPPQDMTDNKWCGWHTDHGTLTGLTCAMYLDKNGVEVKNPDKASGLYIKDRSGNMTKVGIPPRNIAYQLGECSQVTTGGHLAATPHYVQGPEPSLAQGISRNTFAVFMQPTWDYRLDKPASAKDEDVQVGQWKPGMDFMQFSKATFAQYYTD